MQKNTNKLQISSSHESYTFQNSNVKVSKTDNTFGHVSGEFGYVLSR